VTSRVGKFSRLAEQFVNLPREFGHGGIVRRKLASPRQTQAMFAAHGMAFASHETGNDRPSALSAPGVAPAVDAEFRAAKKPDELCGTSLIASLAHVVSLIVPGWLLAIDAARVNVTVPKFASGTIVHRPPEVHADGASAIHSAELRSGAATCSAFVKLVLRVRFLIWTSTVVPLTFTDVVIWSPALTFSGTSTADAGRISYHA
jgi:hypothetical protein